MNYEDILKTIDKGELAPIYLMYGEEEILADDFIVKAKVAACGSASDNMNTEVLWGDEIKGNAITDRAKTLPFLGERRLIIVRGVDLLSKDEQDKLLPYLASPVPSTTVIFTAEKIDTRRKFYSTLIKKHISANLIHLKKPEAIRWGIGRSKSKGIDVTDRGIGLLVELVGTNLRQIDTELEKLAAYLNGRKGDCQDVEEITTGRFNESIFALTDAIGLKDTVKGLRTLNKLIEDGEAPQGIFSMITRQIRLIWLVKALKQKNVPMGEIASRAGFPLFLLKSYLKQADNFKGKTLRKSFSKLKDADLKLKSDLRPNIVLENLILGLCLD
ncbi:MAG: DNA polymerase III subunit delta [Nitrospinota bacterium]|nr:DNA polymerase III subunit delta [Nitrospinota bacterium]